MHAYAGARFSATHEYMQIHMSTLQFLHSLSVSELLIALCGLLECLCASIAFSCCSDTVCWDGGGASLVA